MDTKAFRKASSGVYIVSAAHEGQRAGCIINTFVQVTSKPAQASIAINKENVTTDVVLKAGYFAVSILAQDAPMELIGRFGFKSSTDVDKFADTEWHEGAQGAPVVTDHAVASFVFTVAQTLDVGSHLLVIGEAVEAEALSDAAPLTYADYHLIKGGKTPPKASSYEGDAPATEAAAKTAGAPTSAAATGNDTPASAAATGDTPKYAWRCTVCGYIEYVDELPDDFECPVCGLGKDVFERIEL